MPNAAAALLLVSAGALGVGASPGAGRVPEAASAGAGGVAGPPGPRKCAPRVGGNPDLPETVVIIDHQPLDVPPSEWNHTDHDIRWVEVVCWSWVEAYYGVQVRNGAIYVLTDEGLARTRQGQIARLEAIIAAQDRHLRTHAAYARTLRELTGVGVASDYDLPEYFQVDLEETAVGWAARVEPSERWLAGFRGSVPAPSCYVFVGAPPDGWESIAADDRRAPAEREPVCIEPRYEDEAGADGG